MKKIPPHEKKNLKKKKKKAHPTPTIDHKPETRKHPLYGKVPILYDENGYFASYDPAYRPKLPPGAVKGDVSLQDFSGYIPHYFYIDKTYRCIDCEIEFVFSAQEQKYWYETVKFNVSIQPMRCLNCRRTKRTQRTLRNQLATTSSQIQDNPDDVEIILAYIIALYNYFCYFGQGNLEQGISAARHAQKLAPTNTDTYYWEAVCQDTAGFSVKAHQSYLDYLEAAKYNPYNRTLLAHAQERLADLNDGFLRTSD